MRFEFREGHLDRVEIGRELREEEDNGTARRECPAAQPCNEGLCSPLSEGSAGLEACAAEGSPAKPAHVGLHGVRLAIGMRLLVSLTINEHQPPGLSLHRGLAIMLPVRPGRFYISALLFRRQQRFFYR